MVHFRETLSRWLSKGGTGSPRCPACEASLPLECSFCPHCYMVLRPEGMADLQQALQGQKIREDIYILRKLHDGHDEDVIPVREPCAPPSAPPALPARSVQLDLSHCTAVPSAPPGDVTTPPPRKSAPRTRRPPPQPLMTYAFAGDPPAGLDDLPSLIRWFLKNDRLLPNNLEILAEAHRIHYGLEDGWTYERHLASTIADDLRTYDSPELLQGHLTLLTTVYARTLEALRTLASPYPYLRTPADLPEGERHKMWGLCLTLGLTATRLRVEGWTYQSRYGAFLDITMDTAKRRSGARKSQRGV